jgi:hypothetical protein
MKMTIPENPFPMPHSRRDFLKTTALATGGLALASSATSAWGAAASPGATQQLSDLPSGATPKPLTLSHFPSRLHAFVWRNWSLITPERMAQVVGAKPADIVRLGKAMGLGNPPRITRDQQARSYITVIKCNWHLLPYEQVLQLLGWDVAQLNFTLREDDFLYIKLGRLKPKCDPLRYEPPDDRVLRREKEIAAIVQKEFSGLLVEGPEPLFTFVERLSQRPPKSAGRPNDGDLRFCYSYFALYGDPLLEKHADPYPDGLLAQLAQAGVNGVWLQAVLHKLAPCPWEPERSARYPERLKNLRKLVDRAQRHGIKVFLYLNEPRAMSLRFFQKHPQLKGPVESDYGALCTSTSEVQTFLTNSIATICRAVPDLGGFFSITASENLTNCWSHNGGAQCPRCSRRPPADVIAEVNRLFQAGIHKAGTRAQLIAWDWGWNDAWAGDVIKRLPAEVALQSVSEWSLPIERGGVKSKVGEYSISSIGPGPRALKNWELARERNLKTIAKIQASNTWELSAVPYIPAVENVARHAERLHAEHINGLMLGWTLGGYPSPNLEVVSETLACGSAQEAMQRVAERRFGPVLAPAAIKAWRAFSAAFSEFPYDVAVVYNSPQQVGPSNPLWNSPTGYAATMVGFPYDDLDSWRGIYPSEIFIRQFDTVADGFERALAEWKSATAAVTAGKDQLGALAAEQRVAEACAIHFRSSANQAKYVGTRRKLAEEKDASIALTQREELRRILKSEIELARRLYQIQSCDSRIGFEASNQYYYVPLDLVEKVLNCRNLLAQLQS